MDWNKLKSIYEPEETKYDWETLKSKFEPETEKKDWESLKAKFEPEAVTPPVEVPTIPEEPKTIGEWYKSQKPISPKELGFGKGKVSNEELVAMFTVPLVGAALITNPIVVGVGIAKYMALSEVVNAIVSKVKGIKYKPFANKKLSDLTSDETAQWTKDLMDVTEMFGKGAIIAATDKNVMKLWNTFTKSTTTEYGLDKDMYISADKVRSIFQTGKEISPEEQQFITDLHLTASQYKNAIKNGIEIKIPAEEITTLGDRPWYAKAKEFFNIKPSSETVISKGRAVKIEPNIIISGEVKPTVALLEGKVGMPEIPVVTPPITEKTMGVEVKPEKLITPVGTVSGEKGSVYIPSMAEVQNIATKMAGVVSIEAPFIKSGAKETGFQVKNYYNNIGVAHGQGLDEINKLNKFNFKTPIAIESGFKISKDIDYTDLTYISENPFLISKLTPEEKVKITPANKSIRDFYKKWEDKLRDIGWLEEPFPQSLITRNNRTIGNLKGSLGTTKSPETRTKILEEIKNLTDINKRIEDQNIQFVSVPAKLILAKMDTNPELRAKVMSILPHWGRTTITVKDLVDRGIITRKEADIRYIIGEYSDRMGRKYALGQIFENAEKEGLIKSSVEKPDWPTARIVMNGQRVSIPQLRGKRLDPFFNDVITKFFGRGQGILEGTLGNTLGVVKMMQFYNPLFMPMYDVWQSAAAGTFLNPIEGAKSIYKGIEDTIKKTDNYYTASENGLFSKPFIIPYDKFEYQFTEAMKGNKLGILAKKVALPTNWIPMLYQGSWNIAWKLDETTRMITFNYLKDRGYTDREAGQLAALYHSDYASVPPATRKLLNKIFFTPTFKMTMGKLYLNMLKGSAKVAIKVPAKLIGKEITVSKQEENLARGAAIGLGIMMGIKLYFQSKGYKEEELFRKYVKTVETDEGPKENVITLANPFNIPWRYYYRVKNAFKPQTTNVAEKLVEVVKWDLHPMWRVASDVVQNFDGTKPIYNGYDDSETIALDLGKYVVGKLVAITGGMLESSETGNISLKNFKALQNDIGKLEAYIIKPFIFNYLREPKEIRKGWALRKLQNDFRSQTLNAPSTNQKKNYIRLQNFYKRLQEIQKEFQ